MLGQRQHDHLCRNNGDSVHLAIVQAVKKSGCTGGYSSGPMAIRSLAIPGPPVMDYYEAVVLDPEGNLIEVTV